MKWGVHVSCLVPAVLVQRMGSKVKANKRGCASFHVCTETKDIQQRPMLPVCIFLLHYPANSNDRGGRKRTWTQRRYTRLQTTTLWRGRQNQGLTNEEKAGRGRVKVSADPLPTETMKKAVFIFPQTLKGTKPWFEHCSTAGTRAGSCFTNLPLHYKQYGNQRRRCIVIGWGV